MSKDFSHIDLGALTWRKSTKSSPSGDDCVEVAMLPGGAGVALRDSKNPDGPVLFYTPSEWGAFVEGVNNDEFNI